MYMYMENSNVAYTILYHPFFCSKYYMHYTSIGNLIGHHREIFRRNPLFIGMRLPEAREVESLEKRYPQLSPSTMDIVKVGFLTKLMNAQWRLQCLVYVHVLICITVKEGRVMSGLP